MKVRISLAFLMQRDAQPVAQIDDAVVAEIGTGFDGRGIDGDHARIDRGAFQKFLSFASNL